MLQDAIERSGAAFDALHGMTVGADILVIVSWSPGNEPGSFEPAAVA